MRGYLSVRLSDGTTDRLVTRHVKGLRFTKTAPGGNRDAALTLDLPRSAFPGLGPNDRLYVYDSRSARPLWDGYLTNPGAIDGTSGQSFDLAALGGMSLASDHSEKCLYVDRDVNQWKIQLSVPSASVEVDSDGKLMCSLNPGSPVTTGSKSEAIYTGFIGTTQKLARYTYTWVGGKTDAGYVVMDGAGPLDPATGIGTAGYTDETNASLTTAGGTVSKTTTDFGDTDNYCIVRIKRTGGATNVADATTYAKFSDLTVYARLLNADGTLAANTTSVTASAVVADVVARLLGQVDPKRVTIDTTTTQILDQFTFPDGANAAEILNSLALYEPDYYWGIGVSTVNGKHEFWFRAWPTEPRYEISVKDGYTAPGGEDDLANRIAVYWTDKAGAQRMTLVGQEVTDLGAGNPVNPDGSPNASFTGRIRDADPVTLPTGHGSSANAGLVGQQVLATKATPSKAGTAVVTRRILDRLTGRMVWPEEIEPGYVARVRETGDNMRITELEYVDDDRAATLTLGTPMRNPDQLIADVTRKSRAA